MLQRLIILGAVLLAVQIGMTIALNGENKGLLESSPNTLFLPLNPAEVTSIEITGEENKHLILEKSDNGWILPNTFSVQADSEQVDKLLEKLATVKQGLVVATSGGAPKRFKTADDVFERHLVIKAGSDTVGDFYLGSSAGFRHSHVRKANLSEVTTLPLSNFEVDIDADKWLDRDLAKLTMDDIKALQISDINITRTETGWSADTLPNDQLNGEAVENLLTKVSSLAVQSVLEPEDASSLFDGDEAAQFSVTMKDNTEITYRIVKQDDQYILNMSNSDLYFKVNTYQAEGISEVYLDTLTSKGEDGEENPRDDL